MNWPQLAYQYVIGGIFFAVTLYLCTRPGAANLRNPSDRRTVAWLLAGLLGYLILHAGWIALAGG